MADFSNVTPLAFREDLENLDAKVPDPALEPGDRFLTTVDGALVYADAPASVVVSETAPTDTDVLWVNTEDDTSITDVPDPSAETDGRFLATVDGVLSYKNQADTLLGVLTSANRLLSADSLVAAPGEPEPIVADLLGNPWIDLNNGQYERTSQGLRSTLNNAWVRGLVVDVGTPDVVIEVDMPDGTRNWRLMFRVIDNDNYLALTYGSGAMQMHAVTDGASTVISQPPYYNQVGNTQGYIKTRVICRSEHIYWEHDNGQTRVDVDLSSDQQLLFNTPTMFGLSVMRHYTPGPKNFRIYQ